MQTSDHLKLQFIQKLVEFLKTTQHNKVDLVVEAIDQNKVGKNLKSLLLYNKASSKVKDMKLIVFKKVDRSSQCKKSSLAAPVKINNTIVESNYIPSTMKNYCLEQMTQMSSPTTQKRDLSNYQVLKYQIGVLSKAPLKKTKTSNDQ